MGIRLYAFAKSSLLKAGETVIKKLVLKYKSKKYFYDLASKIHLQASFLLFL
jgi:hypothetical protein